MTRKIMKLLKGADSTGDLILPVKANPDLPIKLLLRRYRELESRRVATTGGQEK